MDITFLSNTCIGHQMFVELKLNKQYNTPLIGTLFVNDYDFIKYCSNINYYIDVKPVFGKSNHKYLWNRGELARNGDYPIMILDDIEIHWIHEKGGDLENVMNKYNRRNERFKEFLQKEKRKIVAILSYSQFLSNHKNISQVVNDFFKSSSDMDLIFIGPSNIEHRLDMAHNNIYLSEGSWNSFNRQRDHNCLYTINDQGLIRNKVIEYLKSTDYFEAIYQ